MNRPRGAGITAFLAAVLILFPCLVAAQSEIPAADPPVDTVRLAPRGAITADTIHSNAIDESDWPNPTTTMFKSMLVPGWGQITNKSYIKAGLAIGLEVSFFTLAVVNWSKANNALDNFRADPGNLEAFNEYQFYWGQRTDFLWLLGLTVFVSMFDAYVDAHLRPYEGDTIPGVEPPKGLKLVIPF